MGPLNPNGGTPQSTSVTDMSYDCKPRGAKACHWFTPGLMSVPTVLDYNAVGKQLYTTTGKGTGFGL
jgi:hypothetical protein